MHPQIRQSEPGDCPICGMELVPADEGESDDGLSAEAIQMSATARKLASVQTAKATTTATTKTLRIEGKLQADARRVSTQATHIPGRLEELNATYEGQRITQGEVIARIYSPELLTAQQELLEASKMGQEPLIRAARQKLKGWKVSESQIAAVLEKQEPTERFPLVAEASGYIIEQYVQEGDYLKEGQALYRAGNYQTLWALFDVYEADLPWLSTGSEVEFSTEAFPQQALRAKISYIDPKVDAQTRTVKVRANIANPSGRLKPGMLLSGSMRLKYAKEQLTIPTSAILWTGKRSVVYVEEKSDQGVGFIMREVELGASLGDSYVVESGLEKGELVAIQGAFSIDAAAQLAGKPSMMGASRDSLSSKTE